MVTIAVAVCTAAVLAPVTVLAATGQLVNIADGTNAARLAKVNAASELSVANRAAPNTAPNLGYTLAAMGNRAPCVGHFPQPARG